MSDLQAIKTVLKSGSGKALKEYLLGQLYRLKSIDSIKEKDTPTHQAIEIKAQIRAYNILKEIMDDIMVISSEETTQDPRDSYLID